MRTNRELALAVKRALATGTLALVGAGTLVAYANPAATTQTTAKQVAVAKTTTAKTTSSKAPLMLAQASDGQTTGQAPTTALTPAPQLQTVIVTGTMIPRTDAETTEAITVINTSALKKQGLVNVEQAINQVASNVPAAFNIAQSVGQFTGGGTYANLRDLGSGRTLVLLDGHRLADNATLGNAVDLSGIPFAAIQSMQVLREGASSLYGSDAIAGVVNFITKKDYQGGEADLTYDHPQQAGGASGNADITIGHGDLVRDGYNIMFAGSYSWQNELKAPQRSFSATGVDPARGLFNTNGDGTWPGNVIDANGNNWQAGYPACTGNPYVTKIQGDCQYEYSAAADDMPKHDELSGLLSVTKALPDNNTLALQYFYTRSKVTSWGGPTFYAFTMTPQADPTYFPTASQLTCDQQFNGGPCTAPPDLVDPITALWSDPTDNRYNQEINTEQRALLTFSGDNAGWNYTATLNYSQNQTSQGVVGGYAIYSMFDPNGVLSPLVNPFGPQSTAGQQFINSTYRNGTYDNGRLKRWSVSGHASHRLGDAFHAGHDAVLAVGAQVRGDRFDNASTPFAVQMFDTVFFPPGSTSGSRTAKAAFIELDVPMAKSLDVDLSDRQDWYSDFGTTNNGKVAVRFQPSRYVTFRGSASTGFRAPTLVDLYTPPTFGATGGVMGQGGNPFCSSGNFNAEWTSTVCNSQGLSLTGGNTHLQPETSENFDIGVVISPMSNLGITLDYYRILLKNTLGTIPDTAIYGNPSQFANLYVLNNTGTLTTSIDAPAQCTPYTAASCGYIVQTTQNTGGVTTDGVDLSVQYSKRTHIGTFSADLEGTLITQYRLQEYTGGPVLNLVGWFHNGNLPAVRWTHDIRINWTSPNDMWGAGVSNRFLSSYIDQHMEPSPAFVPAGTTRHQRIVGADSTWDVYASYKPVQALTVLFGIRNVLNTDPPFSNQTVNWPSGYNPVYSSPILRSFYLNLKYKFL